MGENAVPQKCAKNSYPETDRTKNIQKSTVIPRNLECEGIFFLKMIGTKLDFLGIVF